MYIYSPFVGRLMNIVPHWNIINEGWMWMTGHLLHPPNSFYTLMYFQCGWTCIYDSLFFLFVYLSHSRVFVYVCHFLMFSFLRKLCYLYSKPLERNNVLNVNFICVPYFSFFSIMHKLCWSTFSAETEKICRQIATIRALNNLNWYWKTCWQFCNRSEVLLKSQVALH